MTKPKKRRGCGFWLLSSIGGLFGLLVLIGVVGMLLGPNTPTTTSEQRAFDPNVRPNGESVGTPISSRPAAQPASAPAITEGEMETACQKLIRAQMKLPDSVKFPGLMAMMGDSTLQPEISAKGAVWSAWVEADNALGGRVRYDFVCNYRKSVDKFEVQLIAR